MAGEFQLADVVTNARGSRTARLRTSNGRDVIYCTANNGLCAPFGPSCFDNASPTTRLTLARRLDDETILHIFEDPDSWALRCVEENAERLFNRRMTSEQVAAGHNPRVRRKLPYDPLLHAKMTTDGPHAIRCWDAAGAERVLPSEWRHTCLQLRFHVSHLWMMGADFGLVVNATDVQVVSESSAAEPACPFPASQMLSWLPPR